MIHVIATIEVAEGKREAFLAEFHRLMPLVHAEAGCLDYGPTADVRTDIAAQVPFRSNTITIVERWANLESLKSHLTAPHMLEYRGRVKDLVARVQLHVLEPV